MKTPSLTPLFALRASAALSMIPLTVAAAHAQTIDTMTETATQHVATAWGYAINTACYIGGAFLLFFALWGFYSHRKNPGAGANPGVTLVAACVGSLLLAFPTVAGMMTRTATGQNVEATGSQKMMTFDE